jgi:hypothetical protein
VGAQRAPRADPGGAVRGARSPRARPALSTANVRELVRAVLPLPQPSPQEATALVIEHLVNRSRSRRRRLKRQQHLGLPP